ncbi:alpha/beta hydrolase [Nocardia shimofusensis]|uniref:alpha/beta hydrolase n=1 Tax=Nocardia shimofusensis TaxID=228596 RepID=UPI00082D4E68|nr:alpha/beta fold hydrolase [Nocardia shimofusensis]
MDHLSYAQFFPAPYRYETLPAPESTFWSWRGADIHIARRSSPTAPLRALAVHGAGGHAGLMWPYLALSERNEAEILAIDLPLYGDTRELAPRKVRYRDWIDLLTAFVRAETDNDDRPLILLGASMGGMLAYEAAARSGRVAHVVATCLLDPADPAARRAAARWSWIGEHAPTLMRALGPAADLRLPVRWLADMANMSADPALSRHCARDPKGGGVRVPLGFLHDYLTFQHTPPETTTTPVTLVHPAADRWTPPELSLRFLARIAAPHEAIMLENCGHFPIEEPGLTRMLDTLRAVAAATIP